MLFRSFETEHGSGVNIDTTQDNVKLQAGIEEPAPLLRALARNSAVLGASPVLKGSVDIASAARSDTGRVYGINIEEHLKVSNLGSKIVEGSVDDFRTRPAGAMIGRELADRLLIGLNDFIQVSQSGGPPQRFKVMAIFITGISALDRERIYLSLSDAASVLHRPTGVSYLQLQLADASRAPVESDRIVDEVRYNAQPWQEREKIGRAHV